MTLALITGPRHREIRLLQWRQINFINKAASRYAVLDQQPRWPSRRAESDSDSALRH